MGERSFTTVEARAIGEAIGDEAAARVVLPDDTRVYPAHGAGSLCGRNISKETWSTIGRERANLHRVWDADVVEVQGRDSGLVADTILRAVSPAQQQASAPAKAAPRNSDGSWPKESCTINDPTTSGCITDPVRASYAARAIRAGPAPRAPRRPKSSAARRCR